MEYQIGNYVFNDWKIVRKISSGASGVVFEIQKSDQNVPLTSAVKIMHVPQDSSIAASLSSDGMDNQTVTTYLQGVVNELIDEIKIMVSLKGFPYIVNCEDYKVIKDPEGARWDVLIRMELLKPVLEFQQENTLTEADVYKMGLQLTKALVLFEEHGIIHRDIKPENIFVNPFGDFKLGDFGIARVYDKTSGELSKKGTENYMAPEVYRGQEYDNTVDIYSLGLVLYRLLNKNRLPFYPVDKTYTAMERQQAMADRMSGKKEIPAPVLASPEFGRIILKMCSFCPEDRYQNASALLHALEEFKPSDVPLTAEQGGIPGDRAGRENDTDEENLTSVVFSGRQKPNSKNKQTEPTSSQGKSGIGETKENPPEEKKEDKETKEEGSRERSYTPRSSVPAHTPVAGVKSTEPKQESPAGRSDKRKKAILTVSALAIILAVAVPLLLSRKFTLTVTGGNGSGEYKAGADVTVTADQKEGSEFTGWKAEGLELSSDELSSEKITVHMPRKSVSLTATYEVNLYTVTVNGGSGSGEYKLGDEVSLEAEEPEKGYAFSSWIINAGSPSIPDRNAPKAAFKMGEENVEVTAAYEPLQYSLKVDGASGSGDYPFGEKITLKAEEVANSTFTGWTVESETFKLSEKEIKSAEIEFEMPAEDIELTALYKVNEHTVNVTGGKGSGTFAVGDTVEIAADQPAKGNMFVSWKSEKGKPDLEDDSAEKTTFIMPDQDIELSAEYAPVEYTVTVNNGNGSGEYHFGNMVSISADPLKDGMIFSNWTVDKGSLNLSDLNKSNISFEMPAEEISLTAHYMIKKYTLKVTNGRGSGMYSSGDQVEVTAEPVNSKGQAFTGWTLTGGKLDTAELDMTQPVIKFTMPESNLTLQAGYAAAQQAPPASDGHTLTVNGGTGSGNYAAGEKISISHDQPQSGMAFSYWIAVGYPESLDYTKDTLEITMPENDVIFTAVYSQR